MQDEQTKQLGRVRESIGETIREFFADLSYGDQFHSTDLEDYVSLRCNVAPGSVGRVMRDLRKDGAIKYTVVNRAQSLYKKGAADGLDIPGEYRCQKCGAPLTPTRSGGACAEGCPGVKVMGSEEKKEFGRVLDKVCPRKVNRRKRTPRGSVPDVPILFSDDEYLAATRDIDGGADERERRKA